MFVIAEFPVDLDIENCTTFYVGFEDNLLARLRADYNGRCFSGFLILQVQSVIRVGMCIFSDPIHPTVGHISVIFLALACSIAPGEILTCEVQPIREQGPIHARGAHFVASIQPHGTTSTSAASLSTSAASLSSKGSEVDVLTAGAIVSVRALYTSAQPMSPWISVIGNVFDPPTATIFYPIIAGTQKDARAHDAMTREFYAPVAEVIAAGNDESAQIAIQRVSVVRAAESARRLLTEIQKGAQKEVAILVRRLFHPLIGSEDIPKSEKYQAIDAFNGEIDVGATYFIVPREASPLDATIFVAKISAADIPPDWVQGALPRPAGIVMARLLEQYIHATTAAAIMMREFADHAKLGKSQAIIIAQTQKKRAPK